MKKISVNVSKQFPHGKTQFTYPLAGKRNIAKYSQVENHVQIYYKNPLSKVCHSASGSPGGITHLHSQRNQTFHQNTQHPRGLPGSPGGHTYSQEASRRQLRLKQSGLNSPIRLISSQRVRKPGRLVGLGGLHYSWGPGPPALAVQSGKLAYVRGLKESPVGSF